MIKVLQQIIAKNINPVYGTGIWNLDLENMSLPSFNGKTMAPAYPIFYWEKYCLIR